MPLADLDVGSCPDANCSSESRASRFQDLTAGRVGAIIIGCCCYGAISSNEIHKFNEISNRKLTKYMSFTSQAMIFPALLRPYVAHVAHLTHVFYLWVPRDHRKKIWFRPKGDVVQLPNGTLWMYYFGGAKFVGPRFTRDVERFF